MTATLRVILDQLVSPSDPELASASLELARALVDTAPKNCVVEAVVPSAPVSGPTVAERVAGLSGVTTLALARTQLAAAWQLGVVGSAADGLVHSPSLFAPIVKHDRNEDRDQCVVTLWDFTAWEKPSALARTRVAWQRAMVRRAARYADAIVVPTHAAAERLSAIAKFGERVRVVPGAVPARFQIPADEVGRRRELGLPEGYVMIDAADIDQDELTRAVHAVRAVSRDIDIAVIGAPDPEVLANTLAEDPLAGAVHPLPTLDGSDRAAVFAAAIAFIAPSVRTAFPWRVLEALTLGVPVVAVDSPTHREVLVDGGIFADSGDPDALAAALAEALGSTGAAERLAVLAADRGRAYSWASSAERIWQLHADL